MCSSSQDSSSQLLPMAPPHPLLSCWELRAPREELISSRSPRTRSFYSYPASVKTPAGNCYKSSINQSIMYRFASATYPSCIFYRYLMYSPHGFTRWPLGFPNFLPLLLQNPAKDASIIRHRGPCSLDGGITMNNRTIFGLSALALGFALVSAPAFAHEVGQNPLQITLAAHHSSPLCAPRHGCPADGAAAAALHPRCRPRACKLTRLKTNEGGPANSPAAQAAGRIGRFTVLASPR